MTGLLQSLDTPLGQTIGVLREDGHVEGCLVVAPTAAAPVTSVFTRTGAVVSANGDYDSGQVTNASTVTGLTVSAALDQVKADAAAAAAAAAAASSAAAVADAKAVAAEQPFRATFYVDPAFAGTSTGSQSNPFKSIALAFAAAAALALPGCSIFVPPAVTITENVVFPATGGSWEISCPQGLTLNSGSTVARITGTITVSGTTAAESIFALSHLLILGNISGDNSGAGLCFLTLWDVRQNGTVTLTNSGSGVWIAGFKGVAAVAGNKIGGSTTGLVSVAGGINANNWVFEGGVSEANPGPITPYPGSQFRDCQFGTTNTVPVTISLNGGTLNAFFFDCIASGPVTFACGVADYTIYADGATLAVLNNPLAGTIVTGTRAQLKQLNGNASASTTVAGNVGSTAYGSRSPAGMYVCDLSLTLTTAGTAGALQFSFTYTDATGTLVTETLGGTLNIAGALGTTVRATSLPFNHNGAAAAMSFLFTGVVTAGAMQVDHISAIRRLN